METTSLLARTLPEDTSEDRTRKSLSPPLRPVLTVQDQHSSDPQTSDGPNPGGKQTFLD